MIPALAMMVKSYRKLGLHKMADDSYAILQASYPVQAQAELKKLS